MNDSLGYLPLEQKEIDKIHNTRRFEKFDMDIAMTEYKPVGWSDNQNFAKDDPGTDNLDKDEVDESLTENWFQVMNKFM